MNDAAKKTGTQIVQEINASETAKKETSAAHAYIKYTARRAE
jgi:hypothetical protein